MLIVRHPYKPDNRHGKTNSQKVDGGDLPGAFLFLLYSDGKQIYLDHFSFVFLKASPREMAICGPM